MFLNGMKAVQAGKHSRNAMEYLNSEDNWQSTRMLVSPRRLYGSWEPKAGAVEGSILSGLFATVTQHDIPLPDVKDQFGKQ